MSRNSFFQDAVGVLVGTPEIEAEGAVGQYPKGGLKAGLYVDLERREEGTMRTCLVLLFIGGLVAFGAGGLTNPTPANADYDGSSTPPILILGLACPTVPVPYTVHCDKIFFSPDGPRLVIQCPSPVVEPYDTSGGELGPGTVSRFDKNDQLDIKVLDDPQRVADVREKVAQFLNDLGCTAFDPRRQDATILKQDIKVIDVEYVVIPPSGVNSFPLPQPCDSTWQICDIQTCDPTWQQCDALTE